MPRTPDYYEILGIDRDADMRTVKRAWREKARTLHPDLPANRGNAHAKRTFALAKEAYDVLSDPVRRQEYDDLGSSPFLRSGSPFADTHESHRSTRQADADDIKLDTSTGEGVASIFADLFGAGGHHRPPPQKESPWDPGRLNREGNASRPKDQRTGAASWDPKKMESDGKAAQKAKWGFDPEALAEAALKGDMKAADGLGQSGVRIKAQKPQQQAGDPSWQPPPRREQAGDSAWEPPPSRASAPPRPAEPAAPRRRGDDLSITAHVPFRVAALGGRHPIEYRVVDASGQFEMRTTELFLPAATDDGAVLVLRGKGPPGEGGAAAGDLRVTVVIEDDSIFRRRGRDVVVDLPITPYEAAAGCRVTVPTLQGRQKVSVPPGVKSGQRLRLRGLGLPAEGGGLGGNQELVIQIQLPHPLSADQLEVLKQLDFDVRGHWPSE